MPYDFNLDDLLIDISDISEDKLPDFARKLYRENYIEPNKDHGFLECHDGETVKFWDSRFRHAFYTPKNWQYTTEKQILDKRRVERIKWIGALIRGEVPYSACWQFEQSLTKRLYTVVPKGYVVWLELKEADLWTFSTAYTANARYIHRNTSGEKSIWKK